MAFGPADRDGTNQNKDRTWKGPPVKLWVTAPAATFPLSPVHQTGITIINGKLVSAVWAWCFPQDGRRVSRRMINILGVARPPCSVRLLAIWS